MTFVHRLTIGRTLAVCYSTYDSFAYVGLYHGDFSYSNLVFLPHPRSNITKYLETLHLYRVSLFSIVSKGVVTQVNRLGVITSDCNGLQITSDFMTMITAEIKVISYDYNYIAM